MTLVTFADYAAVRAAIRIDLTAAALSDEVIALSIYQGAAEAEILRRVPGAASYTGETAQRVKSAAILLTASYLVMAVPLAASETVEGGRYSSKLDDTRAVWADTLRGRAFAELALAQNEEPNAAGGFESGSVTLSNLYWTATGTGYAV